MRPDDFHDIFGHYEVARLAIDGEVLGLMALGFLPVTYFELHCEFCGTFRTIVEVIGGHVDRQQRCPVCSTPRRASALGYGFTRQSLPKYEIVYLTHGRLKRWNSQEYAAERSKRRQAFRAALPADQQAFVGTH
jgi:hypothetical protein